MGVAAYPQVTIPSRKGLSVTGRQQYDAAVHQVRFLRVSCPTGNSTAETEHTMYDPRYQQPYAPPPQAPRTSGWKIAGIGCLSVFGAVVVFGAIGAAMHSSSSSSPSPVTTAAVQAAAPVPARTTAAPAQAPAAPPATTAAAPPSPSVVATFHGSGTQNTPPFNVTATWQLAYAFDCSGTSFSQGNFMVYEYDGTTLKGILVNDLASSKSADSWAYDGPGTRHLEISSECAWTVEVADEG